MQARPWTIFFPRPVVVREVGRRTIDLRHDAIRLKGEYTCEKEY